MALSRTNTTNSMNHFFARQDPGTRSPTFQPYCLFQIAAHSFYSILTGHCVTCSGTSPTQASNRGEGRLEGRPTGKSEVGLPMQHCKFRGLTEEFVLAMQSCAWARLRGAVVELGESSLDLVTDCPKNSENFFLTPSSSRWVCKANVQTVFHPTSEHGTILVCVITDCDHIVE